MVPGGRSGNWDNPPNKTEKTQTSLRSSTAHVARAFLFSRRNLEAVQFVETLRSQTSIYGAARRINKSKSSAHTNPTRSVHICVLACRSANPRDEGCAETRCEGLTDKPRVAGWMGAGAKGGA